MIMKIRPVVSMAVAAILLLAGCYGDNDAEGQTRDIPRDEAWRVINSNLHQVVPSWDPNYPFPENPLSPPPNMTGCTTGKNSLASGPPWSLRVAQSLLEPTPVEIEEISKGFAALEARNYSYFDNPTKLHPENKWIENDAGYAVQLWVDVEQDGARSYELVSSSSCITFEGDDQYN